MIEQQINLYQDRFHDKRLWISAAQVSGFMLLLLIGIAAWSYLLDRELDDERRNGVNLKAQQNQLAAELAVVNAELAKLLEDSQLDRDIELTARQVSARQKVLRFVDANQFGSGRGFSEYLLALSNLHVDEVWLNRIHLAEDFMRINGSSLQAEQIPGYFDRFSEEAVFAGNRFHLFEINRAAQTDWKIDFEIATRGTGAEQ